MHLSRNAVQTLGALLSCWALLACEQNSYTTWSCLSSAGVKSKMVTKKAQMQFQDRQFNYCGSLGERSFFSKDCPANIQDADFVFTPVSGLLHGNNQDYQCSAV
jgi:hypothetical protein